MKQGLGWLLIQIGTLLFSNGLLVWSGYLLKDFLTKRKLSHPTKQERLKYKHEYVSSEIREILAIEFLAIFATYFVGTFILGWF